MTLRLLTESVFLSDKPSPIPLTISYLRFPSTYHNCRNVLWYQSKAKIFLIRLRFFKLITQLPPNTHKKSILFSGDTADVKFIHAPRHRQHQQQQQLGAKDCLSGLHHIRKLEDYVTASPGAQIKPLVAKRVSPFRQSSGSEGCERRR